MNCKDFVVWLRGFVQASNTYNVTPRQWEDVRHMLESVDISEGRVPTGNYHISTNGSNSITVTNSPQYNSTVTYGRAEDSSTPTADDEKVF